MYAERRKLVHPRLTIAFWDIGEDHDVPKRPKHIKSFLRTFDQSLPVELRVREELHQPEEFASGNA